MIPFPDKAWYDSKPPSMYRMLFLIVAVDKTDHQFNGQTEKLILRAQISRAHIIGRVQFLCATRP